MSVVRSMLRISMTDSPTGQRPRRNVWDVSYSRLIMHQHRRPINFRVDKVVVRIFDLEVEDVDRGNLLRNSSNYP